MGVAAKEAAPKVAAVRAEDDPIINGPRQKRKPGLPPAGLRPLTAHLQSTGPRPPTQDQASPSAANVRPVQQGDALIGGSTAHVPRIIVT